MLGFNHTLAGCIIAVVVPAPLVPVVALGSHFLLDMTPHFGRSERFSPYTREFKALIIIDALLCIAALSFAIWLRPDLWLILAIGAFFSTLPDFPWPLDGRAAWMQGFFKFATVIQWGERPYGWIFDLGYGVLFTYIFIQVAT